MKHKIKVVMLPTEGGVIHRYGPSILFEPFGDSKPCHVYITVSQDVEPIKEGDWYMNGRYLYQADRYYETASNDRKIIATTDPKLINDGFRSDTKILMPQLQQSFLKEFVANPDGEYEVEYEEDYEDHPELEGSPVRERWYWLKLNQDNTVNITSVKLKLPPFLYRNSYGAILIGSHGDSDVTEEWNKWIKENL